MTILKARWQRLVATMRTLLCGIVCIKNNRGGGKMSATKPTGRTVNNLEGFLKARQYSETTFDAVKRNTYKYTDCGAWITEEIAESASRRESDSQKQYDSAIDDLNKIYDNLDPDTKKRVEELDYEFFDGNKLGFMQWANEVRPNSFSKSQISLALGHLKKSEVEDIWPTEGIGITVGSIVEGVDWDVVPITLKYPFKIDSFWESLQAVEDEADMMWQDTHGCDDCGILHSEYGTQMINPECKSCEGEGVII